MTAWLVSRAVVVGAAVAGSVGLGRPPGTVVVDPAVPHAVSFLGSWDTVWYLDIARHGYAPGATDLAHFTNFAFFPGLPVLMRIGVATGTNPFVWGLVASNLAFLAGLVAVGAIVSGRWGPRIGCRATWATALAPPAVYTALAYSDGLLFGVAACAAWAAIRNRWVPAGLLAAAAVLIRPQGSLVALLLVMLAWTIAAETPRQRLVRTVCAIAPPVAALSGFLGWMQARHGSWSLPFRAQHAWGRTAPGPTSLRDLWDQLVATVDYPFTADHDALREACNLCTPVGWTGPVRDLIATAIMLALVVALARFVRSWRSPWVVYAGLAVAVPLATGSFSSMARFGLLAFPLAWPVAAWIARGGRGRGRWTAAVAIVVMVALTLQIHAVAP